MNVKELIKNNTEVGQFIRELRLLRSLTQEQFALTLGVTFSTIGRWEKGRAKASPLAIEKLEVMVEEMGQRGRDLLMKYFSTDKADNSVGQGLIKVEASNARIFSS